MSIRGIEQSLPLLKRDEGFRASAYQDHLGFWTVGYGTMIDERRRGGLSVEEAEYLLKNRVAEISDAFRMRLGTFYDTLSPVRQAVLISMGYQLGVEGTMNFKRMIHALQARDFEKASQEMLDSKWAREQTPKRAERLAEMMFANDVAVYYLSPQV